ncbi:MAG: YqaA family protein, partial [Nanoarchaeota archaeon]
MVSEYGLIAILLTSFITDFLVQPVGPDVPLVLGVLGGKHNLAPVFALVIVGSYAALFCAYFIGKKIGFNGIEKIIGKKKCEKVINSSYYGKWILVVTSFSPVPYIPYLAGMWKLSFKEVVLYVVVPRTIRFFFV